MVNGGSTGLHDRGSRKSLHWTAISFAEWLSYAMNPFNDGYPLISDYFDQKFLMGMESEGVGLSPTPTNY
jgi:hypothetical protein